MSSSANQRPAGSPAWAGARDDDTGPVPIVVFNLLEPGNIARAVAGERIGTLISDPA